MPSYEKNTVTKDMFFFKRGNKQMTNDFLIPSYINVGWMALIGPESRQRSVYVIYDITYYNIRNSNI